MKGNLGEKWMLFNIELNQTVIALILPHHVINCKIKQTNKKKNQNIPHNNKLFF